MTRQNLMLLLLLLPLLQSAVAATDDVCSMRPGYPMCTNAQRSVNPSHPQECYVEWWADNANQSDQTSQQLSRTLESPLLTLTFPSCLTFTSSMDGDVQLGVFLSRPASGTSCSLMVVNGTSSHLVESSTSSPSSPSSSSFSSSSTSSSSTPPSSSSSPSAVLADNSTDGSLETHRIDLPAVGEAKIAFRAVLEGQTSGFVRLLSVHVAAGCCHDADWSEIASHPADDGPPSPCGWTVEGWIVPGYLGVRSDQTPAALTSPWLLPTKPDTLDCVSFLFYLPPNEIGDATLTAMLVDAANRKFPLWKLTNERFDSNGTAPSDGRESEARTKGEKGFPYELSQAKFPVNFTTGMFRLRWTVEMDISEGSLVVMDKLNFTRNQSLCELEPPRALFTAETSPTYPPTLTGPASHQDDGGVAVPVIAGSVAAAAAVVVVAVVVVIMSVVRHQRKRKAAEARGKKLIIPLTDILQAGRLSTNSYTDTPRTSSVVPEGTGAQQSTPAATDEGHRSDHAGRNGGLTKPSPYETVEGEGNPAAQEKTTSSTAPQLSLNRAMADGNASTTIAASQGVSSDPDPTYDRLGILKTPARETGISSSSSPPPSSMSTSRRGAYDHLSFEGDEESAYDVTHRDRRFRIIDLDYSEVQISKDQKTSVN